MERCVSVPSQQRATLLRSFQATSRVGQSPVCLMVARIKVVGPSFSFIVQKVDEVQVRDGTMRVGAFPTKSHAFEIISSNLSRWAKPCMLDGGSDKSCRTEFFLHSAKSRRSASPRWNDACRCLPNKEPRF